MVATISRKELCCWTCEFLIPTVAPSVVRSAQSNFWVYGKTLQILWGRNFTYMSFAGVIIGGVGTAVSYAKSSPPAEYTFLAVLGVSFLSSLVCLKILSNRVEEYALAALAMKDQTQEFKNQLSQIQSGAPLEMDKYVMKDFGEEQSAGVQPVAFMVAPSAPPMEVPALEVVVAPEPA